MRIALFLLAFGANRATFANGSTRAQRHDVAGTGGKIMPPPVRRS
jgi:hypothetical protein